MPKIMKYDELEPLTDSSEFNDDPLLISDDSNDSFCEMYDFDVSIPSISIPSSVGNITIHKLPMNHEPKVKNSLSITYSNTSKSYNDKADKKMKDCEELLKASYIQKQFKDLSNKKSKNIDNTISVSKLAQLLSAGYTNKTFNTSTNLTIEAVQKTPDPNLVVVEIDPAHYFPNEPLVESTPRRRKKQDIWDGMPYKCNICMKGFKIFKGLQLHKRIKHDIEDLTGCYPCECCIEVFWLKRDLLQHIIEHQDKNGRLPCPEACGVAETDMPRLARHKAMHHPYLGTLGRNWFHTWCDK